MAEDKLQKQYQEEFSEAHKKLVRTKYVFIAAILLWPVGLIWNGYVSLAIFGVLFSLGCVGGYIALMHYITAKKRLDE
jgi:hypothetical protein